MRGLRGTAIAFILVLAAVLTGAEDGGEAGERRVEIRVTVTGIRDRRGLLQIILFDRPGGFPADPDRGLHTASLVITGRRMRATFSGIPPGTYAVAVLHDTDADGRLDTNLLGVPNEGFGVSRNIAPRFRSPRFAESSFVARTPRAELTISLVYR